MVFLHSLAEKGRDGHRAYHFTGSDVPSRVEDEENLHFCIHISFRYNTFIEDSTYLSQTVSFAAPLDKNTNRVNYLIDIIMISL
jgi:hypothetical protein